MVRLHRYGVEFGELGAFARGQKSERYVLRNRGSVEPVNVLEITRWMVRIAGPRTFLLLYPFPHPFTIATSTIIGFLPLCLPPPPLRGRPVALIIREYIAVMLSIPPANSNRVHSPTWWYRQEKWPHALQSQHFCVGCGRERGSSPRTRGSERERFFECLGERLPCVRGPPRSTADFTPISIGAACHRNRPGT